MCQFSRWTKSRAAGVQGWSGGRRKREVREPCALDGSLKWKVRPVTGLWPVGLGASGVRQGEALAEPYCASEARAERSHRGRWDRWGRWGRKPEGRTDATGGAEAEG